MASPIAALAPSAPSALDERALRFACAALATTVWISALLFGLFILTFYFVALFNGNTGQWNELLPGLYDERAPAATVGIGIHFGAGGIILVLGCLQLLTSVRRRWPAIHRWTGRVYVVACLLTAVGGLLFIAVKGTIGGWLMDIAFAGYGVAMFVCAAQTVVHARAGRYEHHRAWAIRLFSLAIGSWLYRMDYGFWLLFTDGWGHTNAFRGPFDYFMDFFFYVPNLLVAELFIRRAQLLQHSGLRWTAVVVLGIATGFLLLATYFFTRHYWGPAIVGVFA